MTSVLILRKLTNLEQYRQLFAKNLMPAQPEALYYEFMKRSHQEHYQCLDHLRATLEKYGVSVQEAGRGDEWPKGKFDFIMAFGGDGTLLSASYGIQDETPLIGVRSSQASVGYLCAASSDSIDSVVQAMLAKTLRYDRRHRLLAKVKRTDGSEEISKLAALNDFLFAASAPSATSRYRLGLGDRAEQHKSSGVWISTATGSSAAIAAAGGQALVATDDRFQFMVRELYHQREDGLQLASGIIDPDKDGFWIENQCPSAILALDGEKQVIALRFGDRVEFIRAKPVLVAQAPTA